MSEPTKSLLPDDELRAALAEVEALAGTAVYEVVGADSTLPISDARNDAAGAENEDSAEVSDSAEPSKPADPPSPTPDVEDIADGLEPEQVDDERVTQALDVAAAEADSHVDEAIETADAAQPSVDVAPADVAAPFVADAEFDASIEAARAAIEGLTGGGGTAQADEPVRDAADAEPQDVDAPPVDEAATIEAAASAVVDESVAEVAAPLPSEDAEGTEAVTEIAEVETPSAVREPLAPKPAAPEPAEDVSAADFDSVTDYSQSLDSDDGDDDPAAALAELEAMDAAQVNAAIKPTSPTSPANVALEPPPPEIAPGAADDDGLGAELEAALAEAERDAAAGLIPSLDNSRLPVADARPADEELDSVMGAAEESADTPASQPSKPKSSGIQFKIAAKPSGAETPADEADEKSAAATPDDAAKSADGDVPEGDAKADGSDKPAKKTLQFKIGAQPPGATPPPASDSEEATGEDGEAEDEAPPLTPVAPIWKKLYRTVDAFLEKTNAPFTKMPKPVRDTIGLVAATTVIISLLAAVVLPIVRPNVDAVTFLQQKYNALPAADKQPLDEIPTSMPAQPDEEPPIP